ncbi:MAG: phosphatase PAP2 family protein [bacterium]|nr:phosphatase PAP2 family protein [bacterium]
MNYDEQIFYAIQGLAGKSRLLDFLGVFFAEQSGYFLVIAVIALIFLMPQWKERLRFIFFTLLSVIISRGILIELIRIVYNRPRPFAALEITPLVNHAYTAAFPSGHVALYFALAFSVLLINRRFGYGMIAVATLMGISRIFIGVHWPLDIVGGALVAFISFMIVKNIFKTKIV